MQVLHLHCAHDGMEVTVVDRLWYWYRVQSARWGSTDIVLVFEYGI